MAIYCIAIGFEEFARVYLDGVKLVIPSTRRISPQCLEPKAKINNKMNHNMAIFEARQVDPHAIPCAGAQCPWIGAPVSGIDADLHERAAKQERCHVDAGGFERLFSVLRAGVSRSEVTTT